MMWHSSVLLVSIWMIQYILAQIAQVVFYRREWWYVCLLFDAEIALINPIAIHNFFSVWGFVMHEVLMYAVAWWKYFFSVFFFSLPLFYRRCNFYLSWMKIMSYYCYLTGPQGVCDFCAMIHDQEYGVNRSTEDPKYISSCIYVTTFTFFKIYLKVNFGEVFEDPDYKVWL